MEYPKNSDLTNIKCNTCHNPITYEYVSFTSSKCVLAFEHVKQYAIKCFKCKKGWGPWHEFDISLFPGYPDPIDCPCRDMCYCCGLNECGCE
jgi:hypothetical protein